MKFATLLVAVISWFHSTNANAQCFNTDQFPDGEVAASSFASVVTVISDSIEAGQYCVVNNLMNGRQYTIASSISGDFGTVRINGGNAGDSPVAQGALPLSFTANSHVHELHINLSSPSCGSESVPRTVTIECDNCPAEPGTVGVNVTSPAASFEVGGKVKVSDDAFTPQAGMIRFNSESQDFEGFDGEKWVSFTKAASGWGNQPTASGEESALLLASDGEEDDQFGVSVAISGDYAVVGSLQAPDFNPVSTGAAYVFVRSGASWSQQAKLTASDGEIGNQFGASVAISGDYIIVGAPRDSVDFFRQGSAYIFVRSDTTWSQQAQLTAEDAGAEDLFGTSVSICGDDVIIGAPEWDDAGLLGIEIPDVGAAYIFSRDGTSWVQGDLLKAPLDLLDPDTEARFGSSVCIDGNSVIIGAPFADRDALNDGSAYFFARSSNTWTQQAFTPLHLGENGDQFGFSVSISGDLALIGAPFWATNERGRVFFYSREGESWQDVSFVLGEEPFGMLGTSVSIFGNRALIGLRGANSGNGSAFICEPNLSNIWRRKATLAPSTLAISPSSFGISVALDNNTAIIGSPRTDIDLNREQGSVHIFEYND